MAPAQPHTTGSDVHSELDAARMREQAILRLTQIVCHSLDLNEVLRLTLTELEAAFAPHCCGLRLMPQVAAHLNASGLCRHQGRIIALSCAAGADNICSHARSALQEGRVVLRPASSTSPCCPATGTHALGDHVVVAPVSFRNAHLGAICMHVDVTDWSNAKSDLLMAMGNQIALAIRNGWLFSQMDQANKRLQSTLDNVSTPIIGVTPTGEVSLWSPAAASIFAYGEAQALGRPLGELWNEPEPGALLGHVTRAIEHASPPVFETEAQGQGGRQLRLSVSISPVHSYGGRIEEILLVVQDVTERHRELQLTRAFLRSALDGIQDFISIVDRDQHIVFANAVACRRADKPHDAIVGQKCHDTFWSRREPCGNCLTPQTFADAQPHHAIFDTPDENGEPLWIERWSYPILSPKGHPDYVIEYCRDVTEQRSHQRQLSRKVHELRLAYQQVASLNAQLLHAEKMASIGQMAAGLAHEIDSPLSTIFGYASMLARSIEGERPQKWINTIEEQAEVCRRSVRSLLDFSRMADREQGHVDLNELVHRVIALVDHMLRVHGIEVKLSLSPDLPRLWGSGDELQQLLFNLVRNASDAMPDGGTLEITTAPDREGAMVLVDVADTGVGIPEENLERVFEPFFTTKDKGQGTGLGLAVCQDIVLKHNGTIRAQSPAERHDGAAAQGTKFSVRLPCALTSAEGLS